MSPLALVLMSVWATFAVVGMVLISGAETNDWRVQLALFVLVCVWPLPVGLFALLLLVTYTGYRIEKALKPKKPPSP